MLSLELLTLRKSVIKELFLQKKQAANYI